MNEEMNPQSGDDFETRINRLRGHVTGSAGVEGRAGRAEVQRTGLALAGRVGTEFVAALGVGIGIGLLLDHWLETKPWLMIVFTLLGSMAGFLSIYGLAGGYKYSAGYGGKDKRTSDDTGKD